MGRGPTGQDTNQGKQPHRQINRVGTFVVSSEYRRPTQFQPNRGEAGLRSDPRQCPYNEEQLAEGNNQQARRVRQRRASFRRESRPAAYHYTSIFERRSQLLKNAKSKRDHLKALYKNFAVEQRRKDEYLTTEAQSKVIQGEISFEEAEHWMNSRRPPAGNVLRVKEMLDDAEASLNEMRYIQYKRLMRRAMPTFDDDMINEESNHNVTQNTSPQRTHPVPEPAVALDDWTEVAKALEDDIE